MGLIPCHCWKISVFKRRDLDRNFQDHRLVAGIGQKTLQIIPPDRCGRIIAQRMSIDDVILHQRRVNDDCHFVVGIIDRQKIVTEPGVTPSFSISASGLPNDTRPLAPISVWIVFRLTSAFSSTVTRKYRTLLVLEEQVLGVPAGDLVAQPWDSATVNTGGCSTVLNA
jgi:hypothetical protein